jgi:hypothetical protein
LITELQSWLRERRAKLSRNNDTRRSITASAAGMPLPVFLMTEVAGVCVVVGAIGLIALALSDESDGTKMAARAVRAVGFLTLAGALNGYS